MNHTLETIHNRRSVRKYKPEPLTEEQKDAIIGATLRAPTAGNMMLYSIIEVQDQALKDKLAKTCDNQPFIATAPYMLLFLADYQRWYDLYQAADCEERAAELDVHMRKPAEGDLILAMMDALIAAQTSVIAAESLGIGSCYIGDIVENWETHQEMFNLPQYTFPAALLCFGVPADPPPDKLLNRFDRKFIVHPNSYTQFNREELNDLFLPWGRNTFDARDFPNGAKNLVQFNYLRKFTADFSIEMTRSVKVMIDKWCGR